MPKEALIQRPYTPQCQAEHGSDQTDGFTIERMTSLVLNAMTPQCQAEHAHKIEP